MTEAEWLAATDPVLMLTFLQKGGANRSGGGRRRLRLVGCGCTRRVSEHLTERGLRWLELGERMADNLLSKPQRREAGASDFGPFDGQRIDHQADSAAWCTVCSNVMIAALGAAGAVEIATWRRSGDAHVADGERGIQAALIRDIFGNPFRPVAVDSSWFTSTVIKLAEGIYAERAFDRLPILADALQDAGCDNEDILSHCRTGGLHVRGCWVVDLLTGRK